MKVSQVYDILRTITAELLGEEVVVNEDLSNVVDIGKSIGVEAEPDIRHVDLVAAHALAS